MSDERRVERDDFDQQLADAIERYQHCHFQGSVGEIYTSKLLADLRQQLAEARAEVEKLKKRLEECYQHDESACKSNTELLRWIGELKEQLAEARAERDGFQCQLKAFDKLHWELVDLFDKEARGVSPLHYVKDCIAAQAAELERWQKESCDWQATCELLRQTDLVLIENVTLRERLEAANEKVKRHQQLLNALSGYFSENFPPYGNFIANRHIHFPQFEDI